MDNVIDMRPIIVLNKIRNFTAESVCTDILENSINLAKFGSIMVKLRNTYNISLNELSKKTNIATEILSDLEEGCLTADNDIAYLIAYHIGDLKPLLPAPKVTNYNCLAPYVSKDAVTWIYRIKNEYEQFDFLIKDKDWKRLRVSYSPFTLFDFVSMLNLRLSNPITVEEYVDVEDCIIDPSDELSELIYNTFIKLYKFSFDML